MRVLVVEDDRDQLRLLEMPVQGAGHESVESERGFRAPRKPGRPADLTAILGNAGPG